MGALIRSVLIWMWLAHLAGWRPRPLSGASPKARPGRCWRIRAQAPCTRRRASSSWGGYAPAAASSQGRSALLHRPRQLQLRLMASCNSSSRLHVHILCQYIIPRQLVGSPHVQRDSPTAGRLMSTLRIRAPIYDHWPHCGSPPTS